MSSSTDSSSSSASSWAAELQPYLPDFLSILSGCEGLFSADRVGLEAAKVDLALSALSPGLMRAPPPLFPIPSVLEPVLAFLRDLRHASELRPSDLEQLPPGPRLYRVVTRCSFECVRIMRDRSDQTPFALATIALFVAEVERRWVADQERVAARYESAQVQQIQSTNPALARALVGTAPTIAVTACIEELMHTVTSPALRGDEAAQFHALGLVRRFRHAFKLDRVVENLLAGCSCAVLLQWLLQEDQSVLLLVDWSSQLSKLSMRESGTSTSHRLCLEVTRTVLQWQKLQFTTAPQSSTVAFSAASTSSSSSSSSSSSDAAPLRTFPELREWLAAQQRSLPGQLLWARVLLMLLERRRGCFRAIRRMLLPALRFDAVRLKLDEVDHRRSGLPRPSADDSGCVLSVLVNGLLSAQARAELSDKEDAETLLDLLHRKLERLSEEQLEQTGALSVLYSFFPSLVDVREGLAVERIVILLITLWNARADRLRGSNPGAVSAPPSEAPLAADLFRWQWHALSAQCGPAENHHCALLDLARVLLSLGLTQHIDVLAHLMHNAGPLHVWLTGNRYRRVSTGRCDWIVPDDNQPRGAEGDAPRPSSVLAVLSAQSGRGWPDCTNLSVLAIAMSEWMGAIYPQLRAALEEPLIPDLAQLVLDYVTPNRAQLKLEAFGVGQ